jgi:succinyl-diaminopimelate desuccinylase
MDKTFEAIDQFLAEHTEEMVQDILALIRIDSARGPEQPGMPYGEGPARALALGGEMMRHHGLRVRNFEQRVVTGDATAYEPHLDILAHLDVVPGGPDWTECGAFAPVVRDGRIYGRGAADDKGPAMAALYAIRAVLETGVKLRKNVRLILGSDEECGSSDIAAFYKVEPEAPMTFSPDANWPVVNTEKGRLRAGFSCVWDAADAPAAIVSVHAGEKENVVPGAATATVRGLSPEVIQQTVDALQMPVAEGGIPDVRVSVAVAPEQENGSVGQAVRIDVRGVPCHAAHPQQGANALPALLRLLAALPLPASPARDAMAALVRLFPHGQTDGTAAGVASRDDLSGDLTLAFSVFRLSETGMNGTLDCRVPICADEAFLHRGLHHVVEETALRWVEWSYSPPHHVPADSPFVKTLLDCYTDVTGKTGEPIAIGGGTYVHSLKNGVAFGCEALGEDRRMHGPDEFAVIDELVEAARIFARVIVTVPGTVTKL